LPFVKNGEDRREYFLLDLSLRFFSFEEQPDVISVYTRLLAEVYLNSNPSEEIMNNHNLWQLVLSFVEDLDTLVKEGIALSDSGLNYVFEGIVPLFRYYFTHIFGRNDVKVKE